MNPVDFNLFLVLDLDSKVRDPKVINDRIAKKKQEWNRSKINAPESVQAEALKNLGLIAQLQSLCSDPKAIATHAEKARELRAREKLSKLEELRGIIGTRLRAGEITESVLAQFIKRYEGTLTEKEVRQAASDFQPTKGKAKKSSPTSRLDSSIAAGIRDNLRIVGKQSLYDFLELPPHSSLGALVAEAKRINDSSSRRVDSLNTARSRLCGHALSIFESEKKRLSYDNALAVEVMEPIRRKLPLIADNKVLFQSQFQDLVAEAVAAGVDRGTATVYLQEECDRLGWKVHGQEGPENRVRVCGSCFAVSKDKETRCRGCGHALEISCPSCQKSVPTDDRVCSGCGFPVGDSAHLSRLLDSGNRLLVDGNMSGARDVFERVLTVWPDWSTAKKSLEKVDGLLRGQRERLAEESARKYRETEDRLRVAEVARKKAEQDTARIQSEKEGEVLARKAEIEKRRLEEDEAKRIRKNEIRDRLEAAENLIESLELMAADRVLRNVEFAEGDTQMSALRKRYRSLVDRVAEGIKTSQRLFNEGRRASRDGNRSDAIRLYLASWNACRDNQAPKNELEKSPPSAPERVDAVDRKAGIELTWSPVGDSVSVTYRVLRNKLSRPQHAREGDVLASGLQQTLFVDDSVETGIPLFYAVYTERSGFLSRSGAHTGPHIHAGDISNLNFERGDGFVQLLWTQPRGCSQVEVWRREGSIPENRGDGVLVPSVENGALDETARNDVSYGYLIVAVFSTGDGQRDSRATSGMGILVEPRVRSRVPAFKARLQEELNPRRPVLPRILSPSAMLAMAIILLCVGWIVFSYACASDSLGAMGGSK